MNIQAKIKQQGFTIAQVASKMKKKSGGIGISQGSLSTILNGNPTIDKLKEVADIIGMTLSELVAEDETCSHGIDCPYCGRRIRLKLTAEREEPRNIVTYKPQQTPAIHLNYDDGTKYRYKHPHSQQEQMAILELQTKPREDGMCSVLNINAIDSDRSEIYDEEFNRLIPM